MKRKRWTILFAALSVAMILFIWGNSVQTRTQSSEQSLSLLTVLEPLFKTLGIENPERAHVFLRKAAHFGEFGMLGALVCGFTGNLGRMLEKRFASLPVLIVLSVAVADEFIQHFSGRASMVTDVVLDFAGGLTGLAFGLLCWHLVNLRKNR